MRDLWISCDRFMTDLWKWQIYDSYMTVLWQIYDSFMQMTVLWQIYDSFMKISGPTLDKSTRQDHLHTVEPI